MPTEPTHTPIGVLLDKDVAWEIHPPQPEGDIPHVTHSGIWRSPWGDMRCYRHLATVRQFSTPRTSRDWLLKCLAAKKRM